MSLNSSPTMIILALGPLEFSLILISYEENNEQFFYDIKDDLPTEDNVWLEYLGASVQSTSLVYVYSSQSVCFEAVLLVSGYESFVR